MSLTGSPCPVGVSDDTLGFPPFTSGFNPLNPCPQFLQLLLDGFVAAVQVVDPVNQCLSAGNQSRQEQGNAGPQVGSQDLGSCKVALARNDGPVAFNLDTGSHAHHFAGM